MIMANQTFKHTRKALEEFDAGAAERSRLWDAINCADDVYKAEGREKADLEKLQDAFHQDTKDVNSLAHCRLVPVIVMRHMAKLGERREAEGKGG